VFLLLYKYAKANHNDDQVLLQLISIDYYLHHKIKPQDLLGVEIKSSLKSKIVETNELNHHKYRYALLNVLFNWQEFVEYNHIIKDETVLVIEYDGKQLPKVLEGIVV
jgi:hypothetical protein